MTHQNEEGKQNKNKTKQKLQIATSDFSKLPLKPTGPTVQISTGEDLT